MQQILALMLGLSLFSTLSISGQEKRQPDGKLIRRYERSCGDSCLQELAIDLGGAAKGSGNRIAVRFCSRETLPLALLTAAASPKFVISILTGSYGYTPERILFLRSESCLNSKTQTTATEFWVIPDGAALPSSVESIMSGQVRVDALGMRGVMGDQHSYRVALQKLPEMLHAKSGAVAIVLGYYYQRPSPVMKRRLRQAQRVLEQSGLPQDRYLTALTPWTGERSIDPPDPEPKYPSVFIVEMDKTVSKK